MIAAATGHRPPLTGGYSDFAKLKLIRFARQELELLQPSHVIVGMALGWDTAVAVASRELSIPFDAYIPFIGQEKLWPETAQNEYCFLLEQAREVVVVSEGGYAAWKNLKRNEAMVDKLVAPDDTLLALWSGSRGGTAACVEYAKKRKKNVLNVWSKWKAFK